LVGVVGHKKRPQALDVRCGLSFCYVKLIGDRRTGARGNIAAEAAADAIAIDDDCDFCHQCVYLLILVAG
jgi:hypothetical protein